MSTVHNLPSTLRTLINAPTKCKLWKYVNENWEQLFERHQHLVSEIDWIVYKDLDELKIVVKHMVINSLSEVLNGVVGLSIYINKISASQSWKDYRISKAKWNNFFSRNRQVVQVMGYQNLRITDLRFRRLLVASAAYIKAKYSGTVYDAWYWDYIIYYLAEVGKKVVVLSTLAPSSVFEKTVHRKAVVCTSLGMHTYTEQKVNNVRSLLSHTTCVFVSHSPQDQLVFPIKMLNLVDTGFVTQKTLERTFEPDEDEYLKTLCECLITAYTNPRELRSCFLASDKLHRTDDSDSLVILYSTNVIHVK